MAIDRTGISSLQTGAPEIKYTGDEGPQDPRAMSEIDKIILQHWLQQGGSYGDDIPEEFRQEIIKIYGLDKMASVPEMAEGGIADIGFSKVTPSKDGSRPGYLQHYMVVAAVKVVVLVAAAAAVAAVAAEDLHTFKLQHNKLLKKPYPLN